MFDRAEIAKSIYEARHQGYYATPWDDLTSDRKWFWIEAADAALSTVLRQMDRPRACAVKVLTSRREQVA